MSSINGLSKLINEIHIGQLSWSFCTSSVKAVSRFNSGKKNPNSSWANSYFMEKLSRRMKLAWGKLSYFMEDSTAEDSSKWFSNILLMPSMIKIRKFWVVSGADKVRIRY